MSQILYYSKSDGQDGKICFSRTPREGSIKYEITNEDGKITVSPGTQVTQEKLENYFNQPPDKSRLLNELTNLNTSSITLDKNLEPILKWLIQYINNNDTTIPDEFDKNQIDQLINNSITEINSIDDYDMTTTSTVGVNLLDKIYYTTIKNKGGFKKSKKRYRQKQFMKKNRTRKRK